MAEKTALTLWGYRVLLRAYPRRFRRRFGNDMEAAFLQLAAERRAAGGRRALAQLWARTLLDVAANAAAERISTHRSEAAKPRTATMWNSILNDLRYAMRTMGRTPGATLAIVLTMALGTGAASAVISLVHAVILRPLPFEHPGGLLTIWNDAPAGARIQSGWLGPRLGETLDHIAGPDVLADRKA